MGWTECSHKTFLDHTVGRDAKGRMVWVCSVCGKQSLWGPKWSYWGSIECRHCQTAAIEVVCCSDKCREKRGIRKPPPEPGEATAAKRKKRKPAPEQTSVDVLVKLKRALRGACPNCGEQDALLFGSETGVTHCGCYHEGDPARVKVHVSTDPDLPGLRAERAINLFLHNAGVSR